MLTVPIQIVTPESIVLEQDIRMVTFQGGYGELGVLPRHTPLATAVKPCLVKVKLEDGREDIVPVSGGFVEVLPDQITLLADTAELPDDIDVHRAEEARDRADRRLAQTTDDVDVDRAKAALARALLRLEAVDMHQQMGGFLKASVKE